MFSLTLFIVESFFPPLGLTDFAMSISIAQFSGTVLWFLPVAWYSIYFQQNILLNYGLWEEERYGMYKRIQKLNPKTEVQAKAVSQPWQTCIWQNV